jgi:hypothetical protein
MHDPEKSDSAVVAVKPPNKAGSPAAEAVEPRAGTKGNADQQSTHRTQTRERVTQALNRVRQAARQRFFALAGRTKLFAPADIGRIHEAMRTPSNMRLPSNSFHRGKGARRTDRSGENASALNRLRDATNRCNEIGSAPSAHNRPGVAKSFPDRSICSLRRRLEVRRVELGCTGEERDS